MRAARWVALLAAALSRGKAVRAGPSRWRRSGLVPAVELLETRTLLSGGLSSGGHAGPAEPAGLAHEEHGAQGIPDSPGGHGPAGVGGGGGSGGGGSGG